MIITGIQPSGKLHIGNYFGAIKPLRQLEDSDPNTFIFIADYHAITADFDPIELNQSIRDLTALLFACGIRANIFHQSKVPAHMELAHILGCTAARVGQLSRMTQYKEKTENLTEHQQQPSVGLFTYPVLQAADILLYRDDQPTKVPVGEDQMQHLNLVSDIAKSFNSRFVKKSEKPIFLPPQALVSSTPRIMSLYDARKKMSKSDPDDMNRINMSDTADQIRKKYRKATSDPMLIPASVEELSDRPELSNLLTIYSAFTDQTMDQTLELFSGQGFGILKAALTDITVATLRPIQQRVVETDYVSLVEYLIRGNTKANKIANKTLAEVRMAIGLS